MKKKTLLLLFFISLMFSNCNTNWVTYQEELQSTPNRAIRNVPPNAESGKCYEQTKAQPPTFKNVTELIAEYTGTNYSDENIDSVSIELVPGSVKWESKTDANCKSPNPEDCVIRCLVEEPPVTKTYYIVTDTLLNKQFKIKEIPIKTKEKNTANQFEWVEVICKKNIDYQLIQSLNQKLIDLGYLDATLLQDNRKYGFASKSALYKYQQAHGLPQGNLNIETLTDMGLNY